MSAYASLVAGYETMGYLAIGIAIALEAVKYSSIGAALNAPSRPWAVYHAITATVLIAASAAATAYVLGTKETQALSAQEARDKHAFEAREEARFRTQFDAVTEHNAKTLAIVKELAQRSMGTKAMEAMAQVKEVPQMKEFKPKNSETKKPWYAVMLAAFLEFVGVSAIVQATLKARQEARAKVQHKQRTKTHAKAPQKGTHEPRPGAQLELAFDRGVMSVRAIQREMRVGRVKAQKIQAEQRARAS